MSDQNAVPASAPALPPIPHFSDALMKLWPHGDSKIPGLRAAMIARAPALFAKYGLLTQMAVANFMGECTEECGGGTEVVENLNYRASALVSQWPRHFTQAQALSMQHDPVAIANQAYGGRMGNGPPASGDGAKYIGRGPAQTTGRDAYAKLGQLLGLDLVSHPETINTPEHFLEAGLVDFVTICGCLPYAERDDEVNETRHLNGGLIGYAQRQASIKLWKHALGVA
jgi:putative chitinase